MNISRFEPWRLIDVLHHDLDPVATRPYKPAAIREVGGTIAEWSPAIDILENKEQFTLRADLPGVGKDNIEISMEDSVLSVTGQRQTVLADDTDKTRRRERADGKFYRRFILPKTADPEKISARHDNGVLEVIIPKQEQQTSRRIAVEAI